MRKRLEHRDDHQQDQGVRAESVRATPTPILLGNHTRLLPLLPRERRPRPTLCYVFSKVNVLLSVD
jgi:hypothetical protein